MIIDKIHDYYKDKIDAQNPDYLIHGWESPSAQLARFNVLVDALSELEHPRILDVGCGVGTLLGYLQSSGSDFSYTGVDLLPEMIDLAKVRHPDGNFLCLDLFKNCPFPEKSFDAIYASGIFNINLKNNKEFILKALSLFSKLANKKIIINLLSDQSPDPEEAYFYSNPDSLLTWINEAKISHLSHNIIGGYLQNDYTLILNLS